MFYLYHSNQLDILKELMVHHLSRDPLPNPFTTEQILVQSPGMAQWIKLALAQSMGIAANIKFPLPASFIWQMFQKTLPDIPEQSAFNKDAMAWKLMLILPDHLNQPEFRPLQNYLADDQEEYRLYQLCQKIADTFDQYLVYRPEWIADWESGSNEHALTHPWQPVLWRALVAKTEALGQSGYHRANLYDSFIATLREGSSASLDLPKRIFVFGVSALPPRYLQALQALGQHTDVHFLLSNPCRMYWGDLIDPKWLLKQRTKVNVSNFSETGVTYKVNAADELSVRALFDEDDMFRVGNPLLASMGKLGRDNLALLTEFGAHELDAFVDGNNDSLLHFIQQDILDLFDRSAAEFSHLGSRQSGYKSAIQKHDRSLQLHACHSPMREVEVLHDQLLAMFEAEPTLSPRDVVVMMPDVNAYSPFIQSVFGSVYDERYIPFSISDSAAQYDNPILISFLQLFSLPLVRCNVSELLTLLEVPAVLSRFEISPNEFVRLRQWIEETGIRWGLDENDAARFDLPGMQHNTWLFGLHRMLLGYAYSGDALYENTLPYTEAQGIEAELLGKLAHFVQSLLDYLPALSCAKSIQGWTQLSNQLLAQFYAVDGDSEMVIKIIRDAFSQLGEQLSNAGYTHDITPMVLRDYLKNALQQSASSQKFLAGQVNFCTLMPMRSIPFKVICLLGMNDGVYPRSIPPMGFDLMANDHKKGDRSRRDDDRYLFLEALISAQATLYISYVGSSIRDKSERIPSVLVTELLQYCQQSFCLAGDEALSPEDSAEKLLKNLLTTHALQPFNVDYFSPHNPISYAREWLPALSKQEQTEQDALGPFLTQPLAPLSECQSENMASFELELPELLRFYRHPTQYFFNRRLKVYFNNASLEVLDDEPFEIDGLEKYQLKSALLEAYLGEGNIEGISQRLIASGSLPFGRFGDLILSREAQPMVQLAQSINACNIKPCDDIEVDIQLPKGRLIGWLKQVYDQGLLRYKPGTFNGKDFLRIWVEHLCYCLCTENPIATRLIHMKHGKAGPVPQQLCLNVVDKATAREALFKLSDLYFAGLCEPIALFPKTAWNWINAVYDVDDVDLFKVRVAALTDYEGGYNSIAENADDYLQRCFPRLDDKTYTLMQQWAEKVMGPICVYLEEVAND